MKNLCQLNPIEDCNNYLPEVEEITFAMPIGTRGNTMTIVLKFVHAKAMTIIDKVCDDNSLLLNHEHNNESR